MNPFPKKFHTPLLNRLYQKAMARDAAKGNVLVEGRVFLDHYRKGKLIYSGDEGTNIVTTAGLNHILDVTFAGSSQVNPWYCGIFKNNVTPAAGDTAAKLGSGNAYGECQDADYDSPLTNRPEYQEAAATGGVTTNSANKAAFTMAASITVYGAFLVSTQAKTATTGTLVAAKKFDSSRSVVDDDVLNVTYQLTASSS